MTETAKDEAVKQAVILVFSVVSVVALVMVERATTDPDFARTAKMKAAHAGKQWCNKAALRLLTLADKAESLYESERA